MAKEVKAIVKIQAPGGAATPAPPIGPALGQHGVNIGLFVKQFNDATKDMAGMTIPAILTVYTDRSFSFILKSPPASALLKKAAGIEKGSGEPNKNKMGKVTKKQLAEIAQKKMHDMNAHSVEQAVKVVAGTARSMGIDVVD